MVQAEHDIPADPDRTLAEQSPEDVDAHLAELRRKPGLKKCFRARTADKNVGCTRADKLSALPSTLSGIPHPRRDGIDGP
jgi:hypothetical protein